MKFRLFLTAVLLGVCTGGTLAQPSFSVSIHIPTITIDPAAESYLPMPIPVMVTIYNTGSTASLPLTARISFPADLGLDAVEQGAVIKAPTPAVVQPNDSVKVEWKLTHPVSFAMKNYRVRVWLTYTAADSFETQKLFIVPAMDPPDFKLSLTTIPPLHVRSDSLGYEQNPFPVMMRLANQGGTTVDSVVGQLILPPDYVLDPSSQANPMPYALPMPPPKVGNPRVDMSWTLRYVGATIVPRTDTLRFRATGKDPTGGLVRKDTMLLISVDGLSPRFDISWLDPGAMQYDTGTVYSPHPYPLKPRVSNLTEQWIDLSTVTVTMQGVGVTMSDAATRPIPMMLAGGHLDFTWNVTAERRSAPRTVRFHAEVTDSDGRAWGSTHSLDIPGQPYALGIAEYFAPDTLAVNAEGTAFLRDAIPLSYRMRNDSWYNGTVIASRVQSQGLGVLPPPYREHSHAMILTPGELSAVVADTFQVQAQLGPRVLNFQVTAMNDRGDTAQAVRAVYVPGLRPVLRFTRRGPDHIVPDMLGGYQPNPTGQEYTLINEGNVDVRLDSLVLRYPMDGLTTPEPLRIDFGTTLRPGDSLLTRWNFLVHRRDSLRHVPMVVTAFVSGQYEIRAEHLLRIDALVPVIESTVAGPDTLVYDPGTFYAPNPFIKTLRIRNSGTAELQLDSIVLRFDDPLVTALVPLEWKSGRTLKPDSTIELDWRLQADRHETATLLVMNFAIHHAGGRRQDIDARVFLPALIPNLETEITGDARLVLDPENVYWPNPFSKTLRLRNSGTADLILDSVVVSWTDPGLRSIEPARMDLRQIVGAGSGRELTWNFRAAPHASGGYVAIRFTMYHSGGQAYPVSSDILIPGEPVEFRIIDAEMPDRLIARADGQGYETNPVVLRYVLENRAWFSSALDSCRVVLAGDGVQLLSPQPRPGPVLLAAHERSAVQRDSFFVLPASYDRTITVTLTATSIHGFGDTREFSLFVPHIATSGVNDGTDGISLRILGIYPNPAPAGAALHVEVTQRGAVEMEIHDVLGRVVWTSRRFDPWTGQRTITVQPPRLPDGMYFLRVLDGSSQRTQPLLIHR
ncbi:MAG: T9SS type A sorting domain-containing protein [Bacteroidota bacterium]|jgi:hypothetical protein|nr:T9SS type A sorting domain-containing protein [Bacteroidota bacterium]